VLALLSIAAALTLPQHGVLDPGRSLGGVRLGDTRAAVIRRWGRAYGTCRDCRLPTLYWNYKPFEPQGAGVTFKNGRAVAIVTLWSPPGWRTTKRLTIGDSEAVITTLYGALPRTGCGDYDALARNSRAGDVTVFYVVGGLVYGFGLMRPDEPMCR
jgi:hypothetical protein